VKTTVKTSMQLLIEEAKKTKRFQVSCSGKFIISFDTLSEALGHVTSQSKTIESALKQKWVGKADTKKYWKIIDSISGKQVN
jgi:hypothetical protein